MVKLKNTPNSAKKPVLKDRVRTSRESAANGKRTGNTPKISESQLQASFFKWFRLQYPQYAWNCFAIPNGGLRNKIVAAKLKREGSLSGVWDVFFSVPNRGQNGMWIEFKVGYNGLTENQIKFREEQFTGYRFEVCKTLDEAINAVKDYLSR